MDNTIMESFALTFELFLILTLVAIGVYFANQTPLNDLTKAYLERGCINGGFKTVDIDNLKNDLASNGYDPASLVITVSPAEANNITDTVYATRGSIISLRVQYDKATMLENIFKKLGSATNTRNSCIRYGMSEKP